MALLAEVPAVIGPQHDERVLRVIAGVERVQHHADAVIDKLGAGQVRRDGVAPVTGREHRLVVERRVVHVPRDLQTGWRQIGKGILANDWQFHLSLRMMFKKTARRIQRHVRQPNPDRHEKRSAKIALELPGSPPRVDQVAKLFLRQIDRPKVAHANTGNG